MFHGKRYAHDVLRVVVHAGVAEVETLEVRDCRREDHLRELERSTESDCLRQVVPDQGLLVCNREVLDF